MKSAPFTPKRANKFICEICDLKCCKLSDWIRHTLTAKHTMLMNANGFTPKSGAILECICGKNYKHMSSLCKHKKICPDVNQYNLLHTNKSNVSNLKEGLEGDLEEENLEGDLEEENLEGDLEEGLEETDFEKGYSEKPKNILKKDNLIEYLIKENSEFKNLIMELIKKDFSNNVNNTNNTNNNNTNNTICNNNSFNLNVFLNDKCKGAMNMSEFMDTINIQMSDLENFAFVDYADGVSKILLKNLNNLEEYLRPIHCSDLKRETIYIKENDCWTKETDDKPNLKKAIKQVAFKNIKHISEWIKEHPGCQDPRTKQNVKYNKIVMNSMSGGTIEEQQDNIEKIVKNVVKAVTIDKHCVKS